MLQASLTDRTYEGCYKINLKYIYTWLFIFISSKSNSGLIVPLLQCFSTQSFAKLWHLSCGTSYSILCWWKSVTYIIGHRFATVTISRSSLNLWPRRACLQSCSKECQGAISLREKPPERAEATLLIR